MTEKSNIYRTFNISYGKLLKNLLETPTHFQHLHKITHITYPLLDFNNLPEDSLKKERNIIFQYPIPTFLNMIVGDNFQIKVNEISYINKNNCKIRAIIKINTLIGLITLTESSIYINNDESVDSKIFLQCESKIPNIIIEQVIKNWEKDKNKYLDRVSQ